MIKPQPLSLLKLFLLYNFHKSVIMTKLTTVQVQYEFNFKVLGQNWAYGEDLRSVTSKTKKPG